MTGTATRRIPDALDAVTRVLTEVKNVANLGLTKQLQDVFAYAAENGYSIQLIIRSSTNISPALQDAIDGARIEGIVVDVIRSLP